jgi:hypothetical protein
VADDQQQAMVLSRARHAAPRHFAVRQHLVPVAPYLGEFTREHHGIGLRLQYSAVLTMISMLESGEPDCVIGPVLSHVKGNGRT